MSDKQLLHALGNVDDRYIEEMYVHHGARRKVFLKKAADHTEPGGRGRRGGMLLLLAATISLLAIAAFASGLPSAADNWFEAYFGSNPQSEVKQELTGKQSEILDAGLVEIHQSAADQGYTITMESGLCDGYRAMIKCRIDAPEGVVLDGRNYGIDYSHNFVYSGDTPGNYSASSLHSSLLADEDPTDNSIDCLLELIVQPSEDSGFSMANGSEWSITFTSIAELSGQDEEARWNSLCEGNWEFDVVFEEKLLVTDSVELLAETVKCDCTMFVNNTLGNVPVKADVFSFEIRSLSATIRLRRPWIARHLGVDLAGDVYLIMKDGSRVEAKWQQTLYRGDHDELICTFDRPVSFDEVACIEFPGGTQVTVDTHRTAP